MSHDSVNPPSTVTNVPDKQFPSQSNPSAGYSHEPFESCSAAES